MDEIFARAKTILVTWINDVDHDNLLAFQDIIRTKAGQANIIYENTQTLVDSQRPTSSFDIILFDLISKTDTSLNTDLLTEFFRLLHPNGYFLTHVEHDKQIQTVNYFKMCGFGSCNPLDANSSFLIEYKNDDIKQHGSLWLCQRPSYDLGYFVPLRRAGVRLLRQISSTSGGKKTWTIENDDDILEAPPLSYEMIRQISEDKSFDQNTRSSTVRKISRADACDVIDEQSENKQKKVQQNQKSFSGNYTTDDRSQFSTSTERDLLSLKPGELITFPMMSDV